MRLENAPYFLVVGTKFRDALVASVFIASVVLFAHAEEQAKNPVPPGKKRTSTIAVETLYVLQETTFSPPVRLKRISRSESSTATVEESTEARFSAMWSLDFDWWISGWDKKDALRLTSDLKAKDSVSHKRSREDWLRSWKEGLADDAEVYLVAKAETPDFVVVAYEIRKKTATIPPGTIGRDGGFDSSGIRRGRFTFHHSQSGWEQSNAYADHPVILLWRSGQERMSIYGAYANDKTNFVNAEKQQRQ